MSVIWVRVDGGIVPTEVCGVIAEKAAAAAEAFTVTRPMPGPPYLFEMAAEGERGELALRMNRLRASLRGMRVGGAPYPTVSVGIVDSREPHHRRRGHVGRVSSMRGGADSLSCDATRIGDAVYVDPGHYIKRRRFRLGRWFSPV